MTPRTTIATTNPAATIERQPDSTSLFDFVAMAVKDPSIDVAKLEALLRMQREITADESRIQFNQAMMRLQPRLPRIKKNGIVEFNDKSGNPKPAFKYARWEDVDTAIRPVLNEEGFSLSFNTAPRTGEGGGVTVTGELLHVGGHSKSASIALPLDTSGGKSNLQGYASSTSFGSRYVAKMLLNLVFEGEDDDGVRGGMEFITPEQAAQIDALIDETKTNKEHFLRTYWLVSETTNIEKRDVVKVMNMLATKKVAQANKGAT